MTWKYGASALESFEPPSGVDDLQLNGIDDARLRERLDLHTADLADIHTGHLDGHIPADPIVKGDALQVDVHEGVVTLPARFPPRRR